MTRKQNHRPTWYFIITHFYGSLRPGATIKTTSTTARDLLRSTPETVKEISRYEYGRFRWSNKQHPA